MIERSKESYALWVQAVHELRQPVQSLLFLTQVIMDAKDEKQRRQTGRFMEAALLALQAMLDALGELCREESEAEPNIQDCDVANLIARLSEEFEALLMEHGMRLRTWAAPVTVRTNVKLLETIVRGLLLNAVMFGSGTEVLLACRRQRSARRIEVYFRDQPISVAQRKALFGELRGQRGGLSTSEAIPGLGLVAHLCRRLGGRLELTALANAGHRLALVLPTAADATQR